MLRVALTGGVGSGKSAVAAMLRDLGAFVSQSDEIGRNLMQPGQAVFQAIAAHFGPGVLSATGELDRLSLARLAFDEGRIEELNAIVHPAVIDAQTRWMETVADEHPGAVAVIESALVLETKYIGAPGIDQPAPWRTRFDRIVVVTAPVELRRDRYIARVAAGLQKPEQAAADFNRRVAAQWTDEQKAALADFVLLNDSSFDHLREKVEQLYADLGQEAAEALEAM